MDLKQPQNKKINQWWDDVWMNGGEVESKGKKKKKKINIIISNQWIWNYTQPHHTLTFTPIHKHTYMHKRTHIHTQIHKYKYKQEKKNNTSEKNERKKEIRQKMFFFFIVIINLWSSEKWKKKKKLQAMGIKMNSILYFDVELQNKIE